MTGPGTSALRDGAISIFITHGRDLESLGDLAGWLRRRRRIQVEVAEFESSAFFGDNVSDVLERAATEADAAIILATPDDLGHLRTARGEDDRARQNVWMELGFFWARLGRHRTLLLVRGELDIPSNWAGVKRLGYSDKVSEIDSQLKQFLSTLRELPPDRLTEVSYVGSDPNLRDREWAEVHSIAKRELVITGVAKRSLRHQLPQLLRRMVSHSDLRMSLVLVDPTYMRDYSSMFTKEHGSDAVDANLKFFGLLADQLRAFPEAADRVELYLHPGYPHFAAVVADGGDWGSSMLVQPFIAADGRRGGLDYPRIKLRRSAGHGMYDLYWHATRAMIGRAGTPLCGLNQIDAYASSLSEE